VLIAVIVLWLAPLLYLLPLPLHFYNSQVKMAATSSIFDYNLPEERTAQVARIPSQQKASSRQFVTRCSASLALFIYYIFCTKYSYGQSTLQVISSQHTPLHHLSRGLSRPLRVRKSGSLLSLSWSIHSISTFPKHLNTGALPCHTWPSSVPVSSRSTVFPIL
jgi:hypothetical protein